MENNKTRAYIVQLTDDARHILSAYDFTFTPRDTFRESQPLDIDALRLVLEAAKESAEREGESYDNLPAESRAGLRETLDAISKLEGIASLSLTK